MTIRVYEFSKQNGIANRDLLQALHEAGFEVASHMSILNEDQLAFLNKKYLKSPTKTSSAAITSGSSEAVARTMVDTNKKTSPTEVSKKTPVEAHRPEKQGAPIEPVSVSSQITFPKPVEQVAHAASADQTPLVVRPITVAEFALEINQPVTLVILTLLKWGIVAAKNQLLKEETVIRLAEHYQIPVTKPAEKRSEEGKGVISLEHGDFKERLPVVVVVGHVDHGKTTLLDFIRKTRVAAREKGGITQHLGAYEAATPQGNVVFIDTPGHEAFSKMRMRGVKLADLAVLVVAADDGVMPQTVEAIKHTQAMGVPIIVAINKVDKVESTRIEQVKQQLSRNDLLPEEWGGTVVVVPISAKTGAGIDQLLEMIVLQSQLMELKADVAGHAKGYVLESKVEKGRGPVATVLAQHGHLSVGDYFICGSTVGRVSSLVDSHGARIQTAGPSIPVRVAGFSAIPEAGDYFEAVSRDRYFHARSSSEQQKIAQPAKTFAKENSINLIIKTDSNSSKEALIGSIAKVGKKSDKQCNIISASIGDISESDISLAATTGSIILGLHIKPGPNAVALAHKYGVKLELYDIIYKLLERLEEIIEGMREIKYVKEKVGEAVVRRVFDIKGLGVIAGCYVKDGRVTKDSFVTVWRGKQKIGEGPIKTLQRDKKTVKEVHSGYECAFIIEGLTDFQVDDRIDCFLEVPEKK